MSAPRLKISGDEIDWPHSSSDLQEAATLKTLPKLLRRNAKLFPEAIAQREKEFGIWISYSWAEVEGHISRMAAAFHDLSVVPGDVIALIGDNRPEWVWGEVAAHACRAMSLGIYRDALEDEIRYLADYAKPKVIVAEDEEQVDKLLALGETIPSVKAIVYTDPRGMLKYDDPRLISIEDLEKRGQALLDAKADLWSRMVEETDGADVAILCTTSGTTSNPKLAEWTGNAFIGHAATYLRADPRGPDDEYVAVLPLSWVMEQMYSVAWNFLARMKVNFPEEEETMMTDLREIGPTFVLLSPRAWETVAADIRARIMDARPWKRGIYHWGVKRGMKAMEDGERSSAAEWFLFRHLRDRLGFSRLKSAATGGAAMGPDTFRFFQAMGLPLKQLYGQTEALGAHTVHQTGHVDYETVGFPMPGCTLTIRDPDSEGLGEVLVSHPHMMAGYYRNPEASSECFTDDGWFETGDAGYLTDKGHLVVIDRIKDLATTSRGVRFSPQFIENKLKFSTYVAEAVILGKDRPYLAAMICIRYPILAKWAEERRISFTTYSDLASRPEVYALLREEVEKVNATLPAQQRITKFLLLYKELDADDGELTRTKKVRRSVIAEKYEDIIERIYSGSDHVDIDTVINFQDGTKQRIVTTLAIETLDNAPDAKPTESQAA
ncbi:AMP-binding protein [Notoacmeibacter sp. MSK16QG-6]|uniref:AMP-binding protein n=1 Tax=Notoacmeibacter sp. MSK16QG-6 TaxID=2957982 RepID=UPI0020A07F00|nr:AMP-binding protein [Notoacmeibacter sp. MSK16QG-6]MCP1200279.1 AMP-binding protein [Notoacmeibacter sp. MSK16QG-6]